MVLFAWSGVLREAFPEPGADFITAGGVAAVFENREEFAFVEPEAVVVRAMVVGDRLVAAGSKFIHFPAADRAAAQGFPFPGSGLSRPEESLGDLTVTEEKLEFAAIEPDPMARGTVVQFDILVFEDDHCFIACRAFHGLILVSAQDFFN